MSLSTLRLDLNPISSPRSSFHGGKSRNHRPFLLSPCASRTSRKLIACSAKAAASSSPLGAAEQTGYGLDRVKSLSQVSGVLGCQCGDEVKGKLVDILAGHFDIVARCQVGRDQSRTSYHL
uniref:Uncharacterized protein n=1 Tax=Nelumbo nucifera TaxID=4432 RepID=A0A822ZB04_NELNU|nr:TPA_asm: hypothetical protein HUJ06_000531 [Nelumbo nucifera]